MSTIKAANQEPVRCSKRKRTQVSYYEPNEDGFEEHQEIDTDTEAYADADFSQSKKRRSERHSKLKNRSRTKVDRTKFPFLELPAEHRNRIYEHCLVDPNEITLVAKTKDYRRTVVRGEITGKLRGHYARRRAAFTIASTSGEKEPHQELRPALLAVNRQIHDEAISYLYGQTIHVEDTTALHAFISSLGSTRTRVRDIVVHGWGEGRGAHKAMNHPALSTLADCPNLDRVLINVAITWHWMQDGKTPKYAARQLYRDGFVWLESMGYAKSVEVVHLHEDNFISASDDSRVIPPGRGYTEMERAKKIFKGELLKLLSSRKG